MKLIIKQVVAASSAVIGSLSLYFSISNLEFQEYTDSPLFDWKILFAFGIIMYIPALIYIIRRN